MLVRCDIYKPVKSQRHFSIHYYLLLFKLCVQLIEFDRTMRHLILLYEWTQHNFLFVGWHMHNVLVPTRSRFSYFFHQYIFFIFILCYVFQLFFTFWRTFVSIIAFYIRQSLCWTWGFVMDYTFFSIFLDSIGHFKMQEKHLYFFQRIHDLFWLIFFTLFTIFTIFFSCLFMKTPDADTYIR